MSNKEEAVIEAEATEVSYEDDFESLVSGEEPAAAAAPATQASDEDAVSQAASDTSTDSEDSDGNVDDPYAWIGNLPEEFREQAKALKEEQEKAEHSFNSQVGRVRSLQAQLDEERRVRAAAAPSPAPSGEPSKASPEANDELAKKLEQLQNEYPDLVDLADTVAEKKVASRVEAMEKLITERLGPLEQQTKERAYELAKQEFEAKAASILDTANSNIHYSDVFQSEEYASFLENQPAYIRDTANNSTDPEDAASILKMFVDHQRLQNLEEAANAPESPTEKRKEKLKENVAPPSKSAAATSNDSAKDYKDWFDHFANQP